MVSTLSALAFVGSASTVVALQVILQRQERRKATCDNFSEGKNGGGFDSSQSLTKEEVLALRTKHCSKSVSLSYANSGPLMIVKGQGSRLIDEAGNSYLDTRNNVAHVGHGNPDVVKAVQEQVAMLNTNTRYLHPNMAQLAERLITRWFPDTDLQVVVFVNSGSEANDLALRLARAHTGSKNTIVVDGAYHGHTLATLTVSPYKYEHSKEFDNKLERPTGTTNFVSPGRHIWKVPCPDTYRGLHRDAAKAGAQYASFVQDACRFYTTQCGESVGAFIVEGGMSVAGVILPPPDYLRLSVQAVREAGGVYIADEVQTGLGRLGVCSWAFQYGNKQSLDSDAGSLVPDLVTLGKPFGNGMPLGAVVMTRAVAASFDAMGVEYFNTFGGNPVCAAAGLAVLKTIESERLQEHALAVGNHLLARFRDLQQRLSLIGDIRGSGLFVGIELVRNRQTLEPATEETSFLCTTLKEKYRVLSSIDGLHNNVLVVKPPLTFSRQDADLFVGCFEKAVAIDLPLMGEDIRKMPKTAT